MKIEIRQRIQKLQQQNEKQLVDNIIKPFQNEEYLTCEYLLWKLKSNIDFKQIKQVQGLQTRFLQRRSKRELDLGKVTKDQVFNSMNYCLVCYKEEQQNNQVLDCQCCICQACADQWFFTKIKEMKYDRKVKCPNQQCPIQREYKYEDLIEFQQAGEQMFINYCQLAKDISYCPHCNYKGFFQSDKHNDCQENFVCHQCQNKWSLQSRQKDVFKEIKTYFMKFWSTSNCPQCSVSISKVGGCPQMTCKSCNFKFCWNCKQPKEAHQFKYCFAQTLATAFIQTLPLLIILYIMGMHQMIYNQISLSFQIEGFQEFLSKFLDFMFRYSLYHLPIPLLVISIDNYQIMFTLPRLFLTWIILIAIILSFIQVEEFLSIFALEGFSLFFVLKFY